VVVKRGHHANVFISFYCSYLYQIAHLGDDDEEVEFSSRMELEEGTTFFFTPRGLKNLVLVDELESLAPVMSCQVSIESSDPCHNNNQ
jgi:hypothetical protein